MNKPIALFLLIGSIVLYSNAAFSMSSLLRSDFKDTQADFVNWIMKNQANYLTVEELDFRKRVYEMNQVHVDSLNQNPNQTAIFTMNTFGDRTESELNSMLGNLQDVEVERKINDDSSKAKSLLKGKSQSSQYAICKQFRDPLGGKVWVPSTTCSGKWWVEDRNTGVDFVTRDPYVPT